MRSSILEPRARSDGVEKRLLQAADFAFVGVTQVAGGFQVIEAAPA